jgi:hypothetical protein
MTANDLNDRSALYLLGKVNDDEQSAIEEKFFADQTAFDDLLIAENALTDAYSIASLPEDDQIRFERRLLLQPRQRERVKFARALIEYASRLPREQMARAGRFSSVANWFSNRHILAPALSVLIVAILLSAIWLSRRPDESREEQAIVAPSGETRVNAPVQMIPEPKAEPSANAATPGTLKTENSRNDNAPRKTPIFAVITLSPGSTRSTGAASRYVVKKNVATLRLSLELSEAGSTSYLVRVETVSGRQIWSGKVPASRSAKSITAQVPASLLESGDYIVSVSARKSSGGYEPVGDFSFGLLRE